MKRRPAADIERDRPPVGLHLLGPDGHTNPHFFNGVCICHCQRCTEHPGETMIKCTCKECPAAKCGLKTARKVS